MSKKIREDDSLVKERARFDRMLKAAWLQKFVLDQGVNDAIVAERDYWRDRCIKAELAVAEIKFGIPSLK